MDPIAQPVRAGRRHAAAAARRPRRDHRRVGRRHRAGRGRELVPADRAVGPARRRQDGAAAGVPRARQAGGLADRAVRGPARRRPAGAARRGPAADGPRRQPELAQQGAGRADRAHRGELRPGRAGPARRRRVPPRARAGGRRRRHRRPRDRPDRAARRPRRGRPRRGPRRRAADRRAPRGAARAAQRARRRRPPRQPGAPARSSSAGAGLPPVGRVLSEARSYAERLFSIRPVGALAPDDTRDRVRASRRPSSAWRSRPPRSTSSSRVSRRLPVLHPDATASTCGTSPTTRRSPPTTSTSPGRAPTGSSCDSFFRPRYDRATPAERRYMHAMADLSATATRCRRPTSPTELGHDQPGRVSPQRDGPAHEGADLRPRRGLLAFTVPHMEKLPARPAERP